MVSGGSGVVTAEREHIDPLDDFGTLTPLEQVVGITMAEEIYDHLNIREQLIVDLLSAGWSQTDIGMILGINQSSVSSGVRRIRFKLANTKLRMILEARIDRQTRGPRSTHRNPALADNDDTDAGLAFPFVGRGSTR